MRILESVLVNEIHTSLWDFEIQTDPIIPARRSHLVIIYQEGKEYLLSSRQSKNQRKRTETQVLRLCWRTKKAVEHEGYNDNNCNWRAWNGSQSLAKGSRGVCNQRTNRDKPNYSIAEIGQNTGKCPGDLRRLAVTQNPVKDYQLTLV